MNTQNETNYMKYRGKCKELAEEAIKKDPSLRLVRGWYIDPFWGKQQHWWTEKPDGTVYDPSKLQFPSEGNGEYKEFDGFFQCEQCGDTVHEDDAHPMGSHILCSYECAMKFIGL